MKLPLFIAGRYLFAKKSHNVINKISAISAVGMAVGTAALIIILSIYNGFDSLVKSMLSSVEPDLEIVPTAGKFFVPQGEVFDWLYNNDKVRTMCTTLQDNVFAEYGGKQSTAFVKGVDDVYVTDSPVSAHITDGGDFILKNGEIRYAAVGQGFARQMGINHSFIEPLKLFYPDRDAHYSVAHPMSAVNLVRVHPSCEFSVNSDVDNSLILVSQDVMRELLGLDSEVSAVEIRMVEGHSSRSLRNLQKEIRSRLPEGLDVIDRAHQNPALYKMLRYEKLAVYLIMAFIVLILGFSIFGSLSMLIIEKQDDIATLKALGADNKLIHTVFTLEGWLITLTGMLAGMIMGIVFCLLQQKYGFVKMPGSYIIESYPVILSWVDIIISVISISALGYLIALVPARKLK